MVWTVEAEVADDQLLYLAGDLMELGFWEPQMAIPMSPTQHTNFWKAEVKVILTRLKTINLVGKY